MAKKIGKALPYVGGAVSIYFWSSDVQAKGPVNGTINTTLDAIPWFGAGKGALEMLIGDIIPDQKK